MGKKPEPRYWQEGHLSLSGGGFMGIYHIDVVLAFKEFAPHITSRKVLGTSAGAFATTCVTGGIPISEDFAISTRLAVHGRSLPYGPFDRHFDIGGIVRSFLEDHLPEDAHKRCSGRTFISTTRLPTLRNRIFSEFESRDELIEIIFASCYIPYFVGTSPPMIRGSKFIDGGFTNNLPTYDENTITVSAFAGVGCIRPAKTSRCWPDIFVTPDNVVRVVRTVASPPPAALERLCQQGYRDGIRFILEHNLYACERCAGLDDPPKRGDCAECNILLAAMDNGQIAEHYLLPLREAQIAEDAAKANGRSSRRLRLTNTIGLFVAMGRLPLNDKKDMAHISFELLRKTRRRG